MSKIPTVKLLDGAEIPWLGWGNGSGGARTNPVEMGKVALQAGITHIDTAQGYDNETETGLCNRGRGVARTAVWVTSKLSQEGGATNKTPVKPEDIRAAVAETTARIGSIPDLFLIHNPFVPPAGQLLAAWKEFEKLKDEGKLKSIGVSNFRPQDLNLILAHCRHKPVVNQIEFHPYLLTHLAPVLAIQKEHRIVTEAFGPLAPLLRHPSGGGALKPILERVAARLSKDTGAPVDAAAVLLLWVRAQGAVAVSASGNPENIRKLARAATLPDLTKGRWRRSRRWGKGATFRAYTEHMEVDFPTPNLSF